MTDYEVLGLKPSATFEEIKKRFHLLVKMNHPDKYDKEENRDLWNLANERMTQLTESYRRLSDSLKGRDNAKHSGCEPAETTRATAKSSHHAGEYGQSYSHTESEDQQNKDAERSRETESHTKNDFTRKQKVNRIIRALRNGMSSYEDINDLISCWVFCKPIKSNPSEEEVVVSDDEAVNLIVDWVQCSVVDKGMYTFNTYALFVLRRIIEDRFIFHLNDSSKYKVRACIESISRLIDAVDSKYGKLQQTTSECHFIKKEMKENGLKIGLKDESDRIDYCKYCRHCCYVQRFLHKDWCCYIRDKDGNDSVDGKLKVIPSFNSCGSFERRYPKPEAVSRRKLMQYGIIQYALTLGFSYVSKHDIESFGSCGDCAHYNKQYRYQEEKCLLRGQGDGHSSERWCCKSFLPRSPEYYIKLR